MQSRNTGTTKGDILIVDDAPDNLQILSMLLTMQGYKVRWATNGWDAIEIVTKEPPDLILLDACMPRMDGYEVCSHLKEKLETRDIPIIFLSAWDDVLDKVKAFSLGAADYVSKPFQLEEVIARIEHQLTIQRQKMELLIARQKAETADKIKTEFIANMSHEIRTPMTAILGFADLLNSHLSDPQALQYVQSIQSSGSTLLALINDVLDLSKIEAGKLTLCYEAINLYDLLDDIAKMFCQQAQKKSLELRIKLDRQIPKTIYIDQIRLRQILLNLVGNAIKFTPQGTITIGAQWQPPRDLCLAVIDTGIGIAQAEQQMIFEAFQQTGQRQNSPYPGTGLGLSITKRLTEMMGGTIQVESQVGQGSTFTVRLPQVIDSVTGENVARENAARENVARENMAQIDASFLEQTHPESLNPERQNLPLSNLESLDQLPAKVILIGEDVKSDRNQLHECFVGTQHLLLFAQDGWDTIRIAQDFPVDIILLNFHIPKLTSDQVMQVLRQQIVATATPVILLESLATAQNFEHLQEHLKIPIQATLRKPIDPSQLLTTFSQIFRT